MSCKNGSGQAVVFDINLRDETGIRAVAEALDTTPDTVTQMIAFTHRVLENAERQELTKKQLVTVVMSILSYLVKQGGAPRDQVQRFIGVFNGLMSSIQPHPDRDESMRMAPNDFTITH